MKALLSIPIVEKCEDCVFWSKNQNIGTIAGSEVHYGGMCNLDHQACVVNGKRADCPINKAKPGKIMKVGEKHD